MKAVHYATVVAMQNARRLADSGAGFGEIEAWVLVGVGLAVLFFLGWLISKM